MALTACSPSTSEPTTTLESIIEPTDKPTEFILPTVTNTNPPPTPTKPDIKTPTNPSDPTQEKIKPESYLDFSKYGPIAFIDDLNGTIRLINPDSSVHEWSYTNKDLVMNDLSWSPNGELLAISTTGGGINILHVQDKNLNKINLNSSQWNFEIIQYSSFSPDGKSLVFNSYNEGKIFRVNLNGSDLQSLTPDGGYRNPYEYPSWSPFGDLILYSRQYIDGNIYSMNTDGTNPRALITGAYNSQPVFSPTGEWIAFIRTFENIQYLYVMSAKGNTLKALTDKPIYVIAFSWSADGRYIVFSYYPEGIDAGQLIKKYRILDVTSGDTVEVITDLNTFKPAWSPLMNAVPTYPDCTNGWSRFSIGRFVHNPPGESPNRVRSEPNQNATIVGQFIGGETYILLDGPVCVNSLVFWEIADPRLPGGSGWTAEGDRSEYWLEPLSP
jgi:Tol biopolymer transport system component